jgi:hypothetical protein
LHTYIFKDLFFVQEHSERIMEPEMTPATSDLKNSQPGDGVPLKNPAGESPTPSSGPPPPAGISTYTTLLTVLPHLWNGWNGWLCNACVIKRKVGTTPVDFGKIADFGYYIIDDEVCFDVLAEDNPCPREDVRKAYPDAGQGSVAGYFCNPPWSFKCLNELCEFDRTNIDRESDLVADKYRPGKAPEEDLSNELLAITVGKWACPSCFICEENLSESEKLSNLREGRRMEIRSGHYGLRPYSTWLWTNNWKDGATCTNPNRGDGSKCTFKWGTGFVFEYSLCMKTKRGAMNGFEHLGIRGSTT